MGNYDRQKRYLSTMDEIKTRMPPGNKADIQEYARNHGWESLNSFVKNCIDYVIANQIDAREAREGIVHPRKMS